MEATSDILDKTNSSVRLKTFLKTRIQHLLLSETRPTVDFKQLDSSPSPFQPSPLLSAYPPRVCPFLHKYITNGQCWLQINVWYLFIILAQPNPDIVELRDGIRRFEIFYIRAAVFLPYRHLCLLESFATHRPLALICFC